MRDNPQQIVMYNPDVEILWPGSLIQGKSHRDGQGALLGLTIAQRTPIRVSIPSLPTGSNFREVERPDQATVGGAVGEMLGEATASGLSTPSTITFSQTVTHSEQQLALAMKVSGHYLGFSAKASASFNRDASETTITAQFYQRMFEVVVAPPQTPGSLFSADFTRARLDEQIALGRMGPDNIPVYVSSVVYGRMMMFSITSTATEQEIRGALQAGYSGIGGGGEGSLSAKERGILRESRISVTSLGGDADATLAVIRSGDWSQYFTNSAPLSSAAPLSYTFRNLSDGSIAAVTEPATYNLKQCVPKPATGELFTFRALQTGALGIPTPVRTLTGSIDAGDSQDVIWNHLGSTNQVRVGLGTADGSLTMKAAVTHPETPPEGWANYTPVIGDFNGDGRDDIAWTYLGTGNKTYLGLSNGDGTFGFPSVRIQTGTWTGYTALVGDIDGDGDDDLIWNLLGTNNVVRVGQSNGVSDFTLLATQTHAAGGWGTYRASVGDVNGDLRADVIWRNGNRTWFGRGNADGTLNLTSPFADNTLTGVAGSVLLEGRLNLNSRTDVVWADTVAGGTNRVAVGRATGTGFTFPAPGTAQLDSDVALRVRPGDVNGDGLVDLIWNTTGNVNRVYVSLGKSDGTFDFSVLNQLHSATGVDWDQFNILVADVTGDGLSDVIWNHAAATNRIYVGVAVER
jgi:hypothetical protein